MGKKANLNYRLCGVGINDADYRVWDCPYYARWTSILKRCYSEVYLQNNPSYKGCSICREWVYFSNFKAWMEMQDWEGKYLDKDLIKEGNKVYHPDLCVFVANNVNSYLSMSAPTKTQKLPLGVTEKVSLKTTTYIAQGSNGSGKRAYWGFHPSPEQAHEVWKKEKAKIGYKLITQQSDARVIKRLQYVISILEGAEEVTIPKLRGV